MRISPTLLRQPIKYPSKFKSYISRKFPRSYQELIESYLYVKYRLTADDYIDFYKRLQNEKLTRMDPYGGPNSSMGRGQFLFLKEQGMLPGDSLLDIGCGKLGGGLHAIRFLDAGNYYGIDISSEAIQKARDIVDSEGLFKKEPVLLVNDDLQFTEFSEQTFDYIIAQSVFTHLPRSVVRECFENVSDVMGPETSFFASLHLHKEYVHIPSMRVTSSDGVTYSLTMLKNLGEENGLDVRQYDFPQHPSENMDMVEITLA